jgi:hypothetical protein
MSSLSQTKTTILPQPEAPDSEKHSTLLQQTAKELGKIVANTKDAGSMKAEPAILTNSKKTNSQKKR